MLSLGTSTPIFASTASYFTAHCFAYLQEAGLIADHCSAANALAMARNPAALTSFLTIQEPSALRYFEQATPLAYPEPIALLTKLKAFSANHTVYEEQFPRFTSLLQQGAAELRGIPANWTLVADLEVQHARLVSNTNVEQTNDYSSLAITFGKNGMRRRALSIFYNEVLSSSDFRPSAPDELDTHLNRIRRISQLAMDMSQAELQVRATENFKEALSLTMQVPGEAMSEGILGREIAIRDILEHLTRSNLRNELLRDLWYELKSLIATLPDSTIKADLRSKLETLLEGTTHPQNGD